MTVDFKTLGQILKHREDKTVRSYSRAKLRQLSLKQLLPLAYNLRQLKVSGFLKRPTGTSACHWKVVFKSKPVHPQKYYDIFKFSILIVFLRLVEVKN